MRRGGLWGCRRRAAASRCWRRNRRRITSSTFCPRTRSLIPQRRRLLRRFEVMSLIRQPRLLRRRPLLRRSRLGTSSTSHPPASCGRTRTRWSTRSCRLAREASRSRRSGTRLARRPRCRTCFCLEILRPCRRLQLRARRLQQGAPRRLQLGARRRHLLCPRRLPFSRSRLS